MRKSLSKLLISSCFLLCCLISVPAFASPAGQTLIDYTGPVRYPVGHGGTIGNSVPGTVDWGVTPIVGPRRTVKVLQDLPIDLESLPIRINYGEVSHYGSLLRDHEDGFSSPTCDVDFEEAHAFQGLTKGFFFSRPPVPEGYSAGTHYQLEEVVVRTAIAANLGLSADEMSFSMHFRNPNIQPSGLIIRCMAKGKLSGPGPFALKTPLFNYELDAVENGLLLNGAPVFKFFLSHV